MAKELGVTEVIMRESNPLGYSTGHRASDGRVPRVCLPCNEREEYISKEAKNGLNKITLRIKNRYIDELLRYTYSKFGHHVPQELTQEQVDAYFEEISQDKWLKKATIELKKSTARKWLQWLYDNGRIGRQIK